MRLIRCFFGSGSFVCTVALCLWSAAVYPEDWPQFRGPGGRAFSESARPPIAFGPSSNLVWRVTVPAGYSSPIVFGDRVFLSAVNNGEMEVLCLSREDGRIVWRKQVTTQNPKAIKGAAGERLATPTPVTDGKSVFVLFGLFGLIALDVNGDEQWRQTVEAADEETTASPILIQDKLIVVYDKTHGSFIEARDKNSGKSIWRSERAKFLLGRATPFHWIHAKGEELIVAGSLRLTSYEIATGQENWQLSGTSMYADSSPTAGENLLFFASSSSATAVPAKNSAQAGLGSSSGLDGDLASILEVPAPKPEKGIFAIHSCGRGDITTSHLAWKNARGLPGYSSPLFYNGRLFAIKSGGLLSAFKNDGSPVYQEERINAPGDYYASPVAAADRVYLASENGIVTVVDASKETPVVLAQNKIGEKIMATPALVESMILIRTETELYAFGKKQGSPP